MEQLKEKFIRAAIDLARRGMNAGVGGPFGCVIVRNNEIIAEGMNEVTSSNDPTAHAEVVAIRKACLALDTHQLSGCELYTSCEPCPMCLGAIYWARPDRVFYACTHKDAAAAGFDDHFIYNELALHPAERKIPMSQLSRDLSVQVFKDWVLKEDKKRY